MGAPRTQKMRPMGRPSDESHGTGSPNVQYALESSENMSMNRLASREFARQRGVSSIFLKVALLAVIWWSAAVVVVLKVKGILSKNQSSGTPAIFPYSFLLTSILNIFVAGLSLLCA